MSTTPKTLGLDAGDDMPADVVWAAEFDERYLVEVHRTGEATGKLVVFDMEDDDRLVLDDDVFLTYGAKHGPDVMDVHAWQARVESFVDTMTALQIAAERRGIDLRIEP